MTTRRWPPALCAVMTFIGFACVAERSAAALMQQKKAAPPAKAGAIAKTGATAPRTGIPQKDPIAAIDDSLKAGRAVYSKICRNCHGLTGKGDGISAPPGSHPANRPARTSRSPSHRRRDAASMSPMVQSAVASVSTPGVLATTTPRSVAASTSALSKASWALTGGT